MDEGAVERCDVIVAGLGPTGGVLANLLGARGLAVVVLERDAEPHATPRAVHFDDETMRVFQSIGLEAAVAAHSEPFDAIEFALAPNGPAVLRSHVGTRDGRYGHAGAWWFHQPTLERELARGLERYPNVRVLRGWAVAAFEQDGARVRVIARDAHGAERRLDARLLAGCDGARSAVRRGAGIALASDGFDEAWLSVHARAAGGERLPQLSRTHRQICDPRGPATYVPLAGAAYTWQFKLGPGDAERALADTAFVRERLRAYVDPDALELTHVAPYVFHALQARRWVAGRAVLAGDAAHQMPPFLGQGMCSGVRDASALAWRVALLLDGSAGPAVLDDYARERGAHVRALTRGATFLGRIVQTRSPAIAALRNGLLFAPAERVPALNRAVNALANRKRPLRAGAGRTRRSVAGTLVPQPRVALANGSHVPLDDALGAGFALLVRHASRGACAAAAARIAARVPLAVRSFGDTAAGADLTDPSGELERWFRRHRLDAVLVRPDRYVADGGRAPSLARIATAFLRSLDAPGPARELAGASRAMRAAARQAG